MAAPELPANLSVTGGAFVASGDFGMYDEDEFARRLDEYCEGEREAYVIDLEGVSFISSTCIRIVAQAMLRVSEKNKPVTVRANPTIYHVLQRSGLAVIGTIEQAGEN